MYLNSITCRSSRWSRFLKLSFLVLTITVHIAAHANEVETRVSRRRCVIDGGHAHKDEAENAAKEDKSVPIHGLEGPILGGFQIISALPAGPLVVTCYNKISHLQPVQIQPGFQLLYPFDVYLYVWPWQCAFQWKHSGRVYLLTFDVWNHDGIYGFLFNCNLCVWCVWSDGFYIFQGDEFLRVWKWMEYRTTGPAANASHLLPVEDSR